MCVTSSLPNRPLHCITRVVSNIQYIYRYLSCTSSSLLMICRDKKMFEEVFMNSCPKFLTPDMPDYEGLPENVGKVNTLVCTRNHAHTQN